MKVLAFQQLPYRHLPDDFAEKYNSVVKTPYFELVDSKLMHQDHVHFLDEMLHAARCGFDGIGLTEHSQASYDVLPNPNLQLAALAYATQSEGLDTALACLGRALGKSKEPLRIAEEYAVLDQISGGRLIAGFPISLSYDSNQNQGIPPIETRARFAENIQLIDRAHKEKEPFAFNGTFSKHPHVNIWPRPVQPNLPVWSPAVGNPHTLGGILDRNQVFLYLSWFGPKLTGRVFKRYWDMAEERGRDRNPYRLSFLQCVAVGETDEEAHREYGPHVKAGFNTGLGCIPPSSLGIPGYMDIRGVEAITKDPGDFGLFPKMRTATYEEIVDSQACIVGGVDTVTEQLLELVKEHRIGNLLLMTQHGSMPTELTKKNISLLAEKVMPRLREEWEKTFGADDWHNHWWPTGLSK
ncbi:LLM class flavin-dependent oxidoreductase [Emcibacter nanhaiensis]|uniref:LLM class flavin-dependent oxidoreductase n=1 Tax=Emcibacter nanhaiensis TaxID=1505037 RepID=A0A501PHJ0_9PROT|nr:LLM class flavin-dependent oxidoreductase [Emcibacter nanhaiensis]TPD59889.1 LLM class flavin-dependent oxidoreductase [Emcibacter nanhaiensis]